MKEETKRIIFNLYKKQGFVESEIMRFLEEDTHYFEDNESKFAENEDMDAYEIERWINLEKTLGTKLTRDQAEEIIAKMWELYDLDTHDLEGILERQ